MIQDKPYRTISEAAKITELEKYVLRFWEAKFPQISPMKRAGGRRYYRPDDIEAIQIIKNLLYTKKLTIRGAQQIMQRKSIATIKAEINQENGGAILASKSNSERQADTETANDGKDQAQLKKVIPEIIKELIDIRKEIAK